MENVIKAENVNKTYTGVRAVCDLSFSVKAGTCFGFLGPNGAGKTTMMKMLYGKCPRDQRNGGAIRVFGYDPADRELEIKYLSGVVPQEDNLDDELNVIQNLMIYARFYAIATVEAKRRIDYLLEFLELTSKARSVIRELSGGMKRRLVIARALLNNPSLLILDEPTTGLDPQVRHLIWDKCRQLKKQGTTILLTTHYMDEAFQLCDELIIMHQGQKVLWGSPKELLENNVEKYVLEITSSGPLEMILSSIPAEIQVESSSETARLFSDDFDKLRSITDTLDGTYYFLRQSNLEDVFLRATGRALNDAQ